MIRLQKKVPILLLAAGIAGGMFVAGCSGKGARQEAVATVNGDPIKVSELREFLGVPAGVFAVPDIPVERKKEALDQLVSARLLSQEGRALGLDNTPEFKEILRQNEPMVRVNALIRKEIEAKLKVAEKELKAEIAKVKEGNRGISDADAAMQAVKSISGSRLQKIQEELIAVAGKETGASDNAVSADRDQAMRVLEAYAKKQGIDGTEGYGSMRREVERSVLRDMAADGVVAKNVEVSDKEVEAAYAEKFASHLRRGAKVPEEMAATIKERLRAALRKEKGKAVLDAYVAELRKKAKITVNDAVLPKV